MCLSAAALSGCRQGERKIAFFLYHGGDTFITEMMDDMVSKIPAGISYEIRDAGNSQAVQNQQIVELIDKGFDLFVINAVDRLACSSIVEKCANSGIPVIFFNREPLEDALNVSNVFYVGAAADSLGRKQADMVADLFGGGGNGGGGTELRRAGGVAPYRGGGEGGDGGEGDGGEGDGAEGGGNGGEGNGGGGFAGSRFDKNGDGVIQLVILKGEQGHQDAEKRTDNCVARLKELGFQTEVMAVEVADWRRRDAYEAMRRLYTQFGGDIELVFSNNDDMALGATDYLTDAGVFSTKWGADRQPFVIVGVDGTLVGLEAISSGLLYGTVNNDSRKQSDAILALADFILENKDMAGFPYTIINNHYIFIDGDVITQANLHEYLSD